MFTASVAVLSLLITDAAPAAAEIQLTNEPTVQEQYEAPEEQQSPLTRPGTVSAQITARSIGKRVEDLSQRSADTMVFANPDGTWTMEAFGLPKFHQDGAGEWVPIEETASFSPGGEVFVGAEARIDVSNGRDTRAGVTPLVTMTADGGGDGVNSDAGELVLGWEGDLPAPVLEGPTATYTENVTVPVTGTDSPPAGETTVAEEPATETSVAEPATGEAVAPADIVVEATRTGFSHFVMLDKAPAGEVVLRFPLSLSEGLSAQVTGEGTIEVRDSKGELQFYAPKPVMWDAEVNEASGLPENQVPIDARIVEEDGGQVLTLPVDEQWLADPERQYPVTVDPTWSQQASDTWVQSDYPYSQAGSPELRVGTFDGGATRARSYLNFNTTALNGKDIVSAKLQINNFHSFSCSSATIYAQRVTEEWTSSGATWGNQPSVTTSGQGSYSAAKGYNSSCPDGNAYFPITSIAQHWANNPNQSFGLRLIAANESNNASWRRYRSANYVSGKNASSEPHLQVTYNSYPNTPGSVAFGAGQAVGWTDPVTGDYTRYVKALKPAISAVVSDTDGGKVRVNAEVYEGPDAVWANAMGTYVASGGKSTRTPTSSNPALVNGRSYTAKVRANDGSLNSKSAQYRDFTVDVSAPAAPTVTASDVTNGGWTGTKPSKNTFTFTSQASDAATFQYSKDGGAWASLNAADSPKKATLAWTPDGAHELRVRALDRAKNTSAVTTFRFGFGGASLTSPKAGASSTDTFNVTASAPPAGSGTVTPKVYWRAAGTANGSGYTSTDGSAAGWEEAASLPTQEADQTITIKHTFNAAEAAASLGKERVPALLDVQVCFTYSSPAATRCTWNSDSAGISVLRLPHAFGGGYPVAEAGPGQVALYTGELNLAATDVDVDAGSTGLSVSRVYSSLAGSLAGDGVFGPGWRAAFDGPAAGLAGYLAVDTTGVDGTISLIGADESALTFRQPGGTNTDGKTGTYQPVGDATIASGIGLEVTGAGTAARITATETDGTITTYAPGTATGEIHIWNPQSVTGPGQAGITTFGYDTDSRINRIIAPTEDGIACPATGALNPGCRALQINYATSSTDGRKADQVDTVSFTAWNPATSAMATTVVADYRYDTYGRLTKVADPRSGLSTTYTYATSNTSAGVPALASVTDAGLAPHKFTYGPGNGTGRTDWLETVHRGPASGSGSDVQTDRYVYGLNPAGDGTNLPNLSPAAVALWDQAKAANRGAAVFSADKPVTASKAGDIAAADFRYASLQYWDAEGYTVNTADYGSGDWQISATDYDTAGNVVRDFEPGAIAQIRELAATDPEAVTNGTVGNNNEFATITRYTTNDAGTYPTDAWTPVAPSGTDGEPKRAHIQTIYTPVADLNPATGKPRMLPLETIITEAAPEEGTTDPETATATGEPILSHTRNGYNAPNTTDKTDLRSGWVHGIPTTVSTVMATGQPAITTTTFLDAQGRITETRQPKSAGNDAGTTRTHYYTAGAYPAAAQCGNNKEYAGLYCTTVPTGTGSVSETTIGYDMFLRPTRALESGGGAERITANTYLSDGRVDTVKTSTTGLTGSTAVPTTKHLYDPTTGLQTGTASLNATGAQTAKVSWTLDKWAQTTSYTNADGEKTTTTYSPTGQVAATTTPYGTTSYTYDGTDAAGNEERRGLPVAMSVTNHGSAETTGIYKAAYDPAGQLVLQVMPGGITQERTYNQAGLPETLTYKGQITTSDGTTTQSAPWITWAQARNSLGQVAAETTPDGALIAGGTAGDAASAYQREYTYDRAGRLVTVQDRTAEPGIVINTDPAEGDITGCTTRTYTFDPNGNRTNLATASPAADGSCTTTGSTSKSWTYDAADRIQTGANSTGNYIYDGLGRQTTIPAADAPETTTHQAGSGNIAVGYYDTDAARTIFRNGTTTTFGLDPEGRRHTVTEGAGKDTNGYADNSDNPSWVTNTSGTTTTRSRYETVLGGDLGITITDNTAKLALSNPHGDTVTTIELPAAGNATGIDSWATYDEYGNTTRATPNTGNTTYAWHGADQRALDDSGLILMGARLYNSTTGQFTSRDPILGGNTTAYAYPQDPVNMHDVSGLFIGRLIFTIIKWLKHFFGKPKAKKAAKNYLLSRPAKNWDKILAPKHLWRTVGGTNKKKVVNLMARAMVNGKHSRYRGDPDTNKAEWKYRGRTIVLTYNRHTEQIGNGWVRR